MVIALFEISQRKFVRVTTRLLGKVREVGCNDVHSIRNFPRVTALANGNPGRKLLSRRRDVCIGAAAVAGDAPARSISIEILKCAHLRPRDVAWGCHMMEIRYSSQGNQVSVSCSMHESRRIEITLIVQSYTQSASFFSTASSSPVSFAVLSCVRFELAQW